MSTCRANILASVLFEVLSFLERSELDGLALTSKHVNQFTTKYFSTNPLNCLNQLCISKYGNKAPTFWKAYTENGGTKSGKWIVKVLRVYLSYLESAGLALWKQALESISQLCRASKYEIEAHIEGREPMVVLREVLSWSTTSTGSSLTVKLIRASSFKSFHFHEYPWLYNCDLIQFSRFQSLVISIDFLIFLENIPKESKLKVQFQCSHRWDPAGTWDCMTELLLRAKQNNSSIDYWKCDFSWIIANVIVVLAIAGDRKMRKSSMNLLLFNLCYFQH
uniref:F-box domain-containing protein n=1 Tax=Ditylenchus dipsaci TaxID=166011 RepID=A0A915CT25_9BILA